MHRDRKEKIIIMKKHITVEQLLEITGEKRIPGSDDRPFDHTQMYRVQRCKADFNIGSMIEFIEMQEEKYRIREMKHDERWIIELDGYFYTGIELCDALFEAMKYVVEELRKKELKQ